MSENRTAVKEWKCAKRIKWCDRVGGMNPFFIIWTLEGLKWFQWADDAARIYVNEGRVNHAEMQRTSIWLFFCHIAESRGYKKRVENWKVAVRGGCILFAGMVSQVSDFLFWGVELFISIYKGMIPSRKTREYYNVFIGVKKNEVHPDSNKSISFKSRSDSWGTFWQYISWLQLLFLSTISLFSRDKCELHF